ncbi:MAG TPA: SDR family NAD(P)-dependent oxidoreductase [Jatrophihabitans sp.]|jgi:NADP-dependent 3-hydroxy acid dehydrogenase YdfG|uniref:SDR family oxidoreductase n=1 Tax=Jatrophihabitans sp. TaxID=1932789 RepID=UPI002EF147FB
MTEALVIGGSSRIGAAIGHTLAGLGHNVTLWGRDAARLGLAADQIRAAGGRAGHRVVDVSDRAALREAAEQVLAGPPLSAVVWAAGLFDWADADQVEPAAWDQLFEVNLVAAAAATRLLLPALLASAPSSLIYLGSVASRQSFAHNAAYVASKHGLAGLSGAVWLDVRDRGVKVSLIAPGLVAAGAGLRSPQGQADPGQLLQPADVAAAVRFVVTFPDRGCPTEIRLEPQRG